MKILEIIWLRHILDKCITKHDVWPEEVDELFENNPRVFFVENGDVPGEDMYSASGGTFSGRFLIAFFLYKGHGRALIVSAREMTSSERKRYEKR
jgi:uncharacterized DUF497 family protein